MDPPTGNSTRALQGDKKRKRSGNYAKAMRLHPGVVFLHKHRHKRNLWQSFYEQLPSTILGAKIIYYMISLVSISPVGHRLGKAAILYGMAHHK